MKLFGESKKEYEDFDEDEFEELKEKFEEKRKYRDLKPENRKRRKEPPKPWGKKERLLVLFIFLGTILIAAISTISSMEWKLPGFPKIKFPSINIFKEETIIIGGDKNKVNQLEVEKSQKIISSFKNITKNLSGIYAFYLVKPESGFAFGVSEKESMGAASLMKLPLLLAMYSESEKGTLNLDTKYILKNSDKKGGSGSLSGKPAGTVLTYRDMARLMGKESDNTAFGIMTNIIGEAKINEIIQKIGMKITNFKEFETSSYDMGLLLTSLWKADIVTEKSRDEILGYLTNTIYENWLAGGITDVRVAHKYGREVHIVNDVGIIFTEKPFIIAIMTDGIVEKEADKTIPEIAKMIYEEEK